MGSYPRFCRLCLRGRGPTVICLTPISGVAAPDLPGVTRPHRRRCDETESCATGSAAGPAHSPCSRSHARLAGRVSTTAGGLLPHRFAPYRRSAGALAGMLSVAVVVRTRLSPACPHLLFRGATLPHPEWGRESGSSSRQQTTWSGSLPSDGSPICPTGIIPRDPAAIKYGPFRCHRRSGHV